MLNDQHLQGGDAGKVLITITETESFSSLYKDAVFQFLKNLVPTVQRYVKSAGTKVRVQRLVFIGTCLVTTAPVGAFTKT